MKTLYDYAFVAKNVGFSVRTEKLSFGHHKLVAGLEPNGQRPWLENAAIRNLSISQMRQAMALDRPALSQSENETELFSPDVKRNFTRLFALGIKAGQGDQRARDKVLSQIGEFRRWLDALERLARGRS